LLILTPAARAGTREYATTKKQVFFWRDWLAESADLGEVSDNVADFSEIRRLLLAAPLFDCLSSRQINPLPRFRNRDCSMNRQYALPFPRRTLLARRCFLSVALVIFAGYPCHAQDPQVRAPEESDGRLEWRFKPGDVYKAKTDQKLVVSTVISGQTRDVITKSLTEISTRVDSVSDDGVASLTCTIDRMVTSSGMEEDTMFTFDSADERTPSGQAAVLFRLLRPMIGNPMKQKMNSSGKISDVEVPESMLAGVDPNVPQMAAMLNKKSIEDMASAGSTEFAKPNPDVGETWESTAEVTSGGAQIVMKTTFEYLGVADVNGRPLHVIKSRINMTFPEGISGQPVDVVDEDTSGLLWFDGVAGRLARSEMNQNVKMKIGRGPSTIEQGLKQTMIVEVN
jgi:Family of unknown function (DUF6263)